MPNINPLVSVIMPTLNCKDYISLTIESVISQTFKDWEFIIVDDNSTDGTRDIINKYARKDDRIVLIDGDKKGIGGALHKACLLAKGEYIARIDADDICLPQRLNLQVDYLNSHEGSVLVNSDYYVIDENEEIHGRNYPCSWMSVIKKLLKLNINPVAHPTCMFRKSSYFKTAGYPITPSHEDLILWKDLVKQGNFGTIKRPLILHRMIGTTLSRKFIGNPYEHILNAIVNKIIKDRGEVLEDVLLYKDIMKKASALVSVSSYEEEVTIGERISKITGRVMPQRASELIIVFIKNIYLFFHFSCWK